MRLKCRSMLDDLVPKSVVLAEVLGESEIAAGLLSFLRWSDCVSLASASSRTVFPHVKRWVEHLSRDMSRGISPEPIPCQSLLPRSCSAGLRLESIRIPADLSIGGPVPPSFRYLNEAICPSGRAPDRGDLLAGCSCKVVCGGDKDEERPTCPCARLNASVQSSLDVPYQPGSHRRKATQDFSSTFFLRGYAPLFECHAACSCDLKCPLRATQPGGGRSIPRMKLGFISQKGWGAFSVDAIPRGTFVAEYTGEALTLEEARKRVCAYDRDGLNYVLITQEFFQGGKQVWRTVVDATTSGNVSRFFNHSCEPTLSVFAIRRGSMTPRLAFFTLEDVVAGSELTYDYEAAGSAGGNSNCGERFSQPALKVPRRMAPLESTLERPYKRSSINESVPVCLAKGGGSSSPGGFRDADETLRRRCLCGSQRCRGLLPCNRTII